MAGRTFAAVFLAIGYVCAAPVDTSAINQRDTPVEDYEFVKPGAVIPENYQFDVSLIQCLLHYQKLIL